jgi:exopolysaccharide biosynthesis polyprenyl glycosylphosphotransferase
MLKEKERVINRILSAIDVLIAWITVNLILYVQVEGYYFNMHKDVLIIHLLILSFWWILSRRFHLNELYRSRPYSIILFNCLGLSAIGTGLLAVSFYLFQLNYLKVSLLLEFGILNLVLTFSWKLLLYTSLKRIRRKGLNTRTILVIGDKSAAPFIRQVFLAPEWGYRVFGVVNDGSLNKEFGDVLPILSPDTFNLDVLLAGKAIDEVVYCYEKPEMKEVELFLESCAEVGVIFRMYSPFYNMLTTKTYLHYFNTTPLLTFSNTPMDYWALKAKRLGDFLGSFMVLILLSPVFLTLAVIIKASSRGPVFFKQKRVGLRGRPFYVYKFRTMVVNAEDLKDKLMDLNEMDGPVFKIANDPRITGIGRFLRKTSLDELPQFINVLMNDMSIVGPRPPIPEEVAQYERWQLRRLAMKPGITCIWQISPSRNDISFDDWMRMDLEYIDSWSLKLDFVLILKTVRTMLRADGK